MQTLINSDQILASLIWNFSLWMDKNAFFFLWSQKGESQKIWETESSTIKRLRLTRFLCISRKQIQNQATSEAKLDILSLVYSSLTSSCKADGMMTQQDLYPPVYSEKYNTKVYMFSKHFTT